MLAWERLHVLARNPIPPASSDNSLSASFPPSRRLRSRHSYPGGADPRSRPTPLLLGEPPPPLGEDRCAARGATTLRHRFWIPRSIYQSRRLFFSHRRRLSSSMGREILRSQTAFSNFSRVYDSDSAFTAVWTPTPSNCETGGLPPLIFLTPS